MLLSFAKKPNAKRHRKGSRSWRRLLVCSVETRLDEPEILDTSKAK